MPLRQNLAAQVGRETSYQGKTLSQSDLTLVARRHHDFLARRSGGSRAILSTAVLSGLDLSFQNFREADFSGADLSRAALAGGNFERATLYCADLRDADLQHANLKSADLRGVSLRGANLTFSVLDGADLRAAVMLKRGKDGDYARAVPAGGAHVPGGVDFSNSSMKGVSLNGANLKGANFRNALLHGASFKGAKFTEVNLDGAILTGISAPDLPFSARELKTCLLDPLPGIVSRAQELQETVRQHELWAATGSLSGAPAVIDNEDIRPLKNVLKRRELTAISARGVVAAGCNFSFTRLQGANFSDADLRDCNFEGADLRGAIFRGARLAHAVFDRADLRPLALVNGGVQPLDLTDAEFVEGQFAATIR